MKKRLKKMLRKVIHIIITLLLIITTAGFTVSKHFCENRLVSVSIYDNAAPCNHQGNANCCHASQVHFQLENEFDLKEFSIMPNMKEVQVSTMFSATNLFVKQENLLQNFPYATLKIPLLGQPCQAGLQQFLL